MKKRQAVRSDKPVMKVFKCRECGWDCLEPPDIAKGRVCHQCRDYAREEVGLMKYQLELA